MSSGDWKHNKVGAFFLATLLLCFLSVWFEILFNSRTQLLFIIAGSCFFQTANWLTRFLLSPEPLFVNTFVSLLHSTITSSSVVFILFRQRLINGFLIGSLSFWQGLLLTLSSLPSSSGMLPNTGLVWHGSIQSF